MKKTGRKIVAGNFLLMELVMAFAIFVFIAGSFYSLNSSMKKYHRQLENQTEALSVMDNFLERLSAVKSPTAEVAEKIFRIEFDKSPLKNMEGISGTFQEKDGKFSVSIRDAKGKTLANIELRRTSASKDISN